MDMEKSRLLSKLESMTHKEISEELINTIGGIVKKQAEATWDIAFKAGAKSRDDEVAVLTEKGEKLCCLYGNSLIEIHDLKKGIDQARQEGRKEVVEHIEWHPEDIKDTDKWISLKKKWGIK